MSAADWLTSDALTEALARIKRENAIEQARVTVIAHRFALHVYADYPAAAARVQGQLDEARRRLAELEEGGQG